MPTVRDANGNGTAPVEEAGEHRREVHLQDAADNRALAILVALHALGNRNAWYNKEGGGGV